MCRLVMRGLFAAMLLLGTRGAQAELSVSVSISGPLEELLPVLEYLRQQGAGTGATANENPLKVEVHSVHGESASGEPAASSATSDSPGAVTLQHPQVEPATVNPGSPVVIRVEVKDDQGVVDTVTARLVEANLEVDLFDNGQNGDATAGDSTWSAYVLAPQDLAAGEYSVEFAAYEANGAPVQATGADGAKSAVTAKTKVTAERVEAPAPEPAAPAASPEQAPAAEQPAAPAQ